MSDHRAWLYSRHENHLGFQSNQMGYLTRMKIAVRSLAGLQEVGSEVNEESD